MNKLLPLVKITSMSSVEIAELTGKQHSNVLRDIRGIIDDLKDSSKSNSQFTSSTYKDLNGIDRPCFLLNKTAAFVLVTGYSPELRDVIIGRWQFLENELEILKTRADTKTRQLEAMESLSHLLPDDLSEEAASYIKANTVVNKAVSTLFGFPRMLKKSEMNPDMVQVRDAVLDDYVALFEVLQDNRLVKDAIYAKWQPKRITVEAAFQNHVIT